MTPVPSRRADPRWVLVGSCTGLFVLMLDSTVVVLALPSIRADLDASVDGLQWIQNGYLLALAACVVSAGRLGDIRGRRRVFVAGMAVFAAGSAISGAAGSQEALIAGRVVQGIGGAALLSLSLALTAHAFPPERQARALGIWAAVSAIALAIGPLVGGALIEAASWRWIFFVNVPVAAAGIAILLARGEESTDPSAKRVDVAGLVALATGLTLVVLALVEADEWGWGSAATLGVLAAGALALAGFRALERRRRDPLVDFTLFRNRPYLGASAAAFALVGAYWTVMFLEPQYLQDELGSSAIAAGAMILPITTPMVVFSAFSDRLIARAGARATMTAGMAIGLAGLAGIALGQGAGSYAALLPGFLCFGISLAMVYAPMSTAAMAAMPDEKAGIAAGVLAMVRVLAGALLLAVSSAVYASALPANAGAAADADAIAAALLAPIGVMVAGTALTWLWVRDPERRRSPAPGVADTHRHHRRFHL